MYGKIFASLWSGSMCGVGVIRQLTFAWMIANCDAEGQVEANPRILAAMFGDPATPIEVAEALAFLCEPDSLSRTKDHDGRRLEHIDGFLYVILNHATYREIAKAEHAKAKTRERVRRHREKRRDGNADVTPCNGEGVTGNVDVTPYRSQKSDNNFPGKATLPGEASILFEEDLALLRTVAKTARRGRAEKLWRQHVAKKGVESVHDVISRGVANYGAALNADRSRGFDRRPKEDATLLGEILGGDWQESPVETSGATGSSGANWG